MRWAPQLLAARCSRLGGETRDDRAKSWPTKSFTPSSPWLWALLPTANVAPPHPNLSPLQPNSRPFLDLYCPFALSSPRCAAHVLLQLLPPAVLGNSSTHPTYLGTCNAVHSARPAKQSNPAGSTCASSTAVTTAGTSSSIMLAGHRHGHRFPHRRVSANLLTKRRCSLAAPPNVMSFFKRSTKKT